MRRAEAQAHRRAFKPRRRFVRIHHAPLTLQEQSVLRRLSQCERLVFHLSRCVARLHSSHGPKSRVPVSSPTLSRRHSSEGLGDPFPVRRTTVGHSGPLPACHPSFGVHGINGPHNVRRSSEGDNGPNGPVNARRSKGRYKGHAAHHARPARPSFATRQEQIKR